MVAEIRLPYPHPGQQAVLTGARRFNWLAAGRRWRKTTLFVPLAIGAALDGREVIWGAPTFDQVRIGWHETKRAVGIAGEFVQQRMTCTLQTGGKIIYRTLDDPDNVRGHTADLVLVDEAAFIKPAAWHEVLRPMLIDTGGDGWIVGTPDGQNWFYREHVTAHDHADSISWQIPTLGVRITADGLVRDPHPFENPDIPFEEIDRLYRTASERTFRQEILAEFLEGTGAIIREVRAAVRGNASDYTPHPDGLYVMGVDWGQQRDWTVLVVMDARTNQVVDVDRFNQIGWAIQRGRLAAMAERWSVRHILAEENSMGSPNIETLQHEGLPVSAFYTTSATKADVIQSLMLAFERQQIGILNDPVMIGELESFEATRLPSGKWRYSAPSGMHDDTVIALALALRAAHDHSRPVYMGSFDLIGGGDYVDW